MIRFLLSLTLLLCFCQAKVTAQVWTNSQDSLDTTVLTNPNDLLRTIPEWDAATTDGFTYLVNSGRYGYYGPQPSVYLDGIPIDFSYFNWQNLNMLPASMDHINHVSYSADSRIHNQAVAPAGFLDLHTQPLDPGFNAYGSFTLGNQIEDPGPWSYDTTRVTPNIDRRGPHYFSRFAYSDTNWYAQTQFSLRQHQPTNLNNHHRIGSYSYVDGTWHPVKNIIANGLAEAGYSSSGWDFKTRILYGNNEEYVFFQPFGREIPSLTKYKQLALQGGYQIGNWKFQSRYLGHQKKLDYRVNNKDYDFDWDQLTHSFSLSGSYQRSNTQLQAGTIIERIRTHALEMDNRQTIATFYSEMTSNIAPQHALNAKASVDIATFETAPVLSLGSTHQLTNAWKLSSQLIYEELLYHRQQNSTYWLQRGYDLFDQLSISYDMPLSTEKNKSTSFEVSNIFTLSPSVSLNLSGRYIYHSALNIPWQVVSHDQQQFTGEYTNPQDFYFTSEQGNRFIFRLSASQYIGSLFNHNINASFKHSRSQSRRYRNYWKQVPKATFDYNFKIKPAEDLSFSATAHYQSATTWLEYQNLDGETYRSLQPQYPIKYGTFHIDTPSFFNIDITAKKWFWDRRFVTSFSVRNLLNTEVRYHTLGLDKALQFIIKTSLSF
ncbi:TonB-dependent receptor [Fodinibius salsisoli]|uniref:Outer membrane receptor proteins, mostly Fe transport n=1 Tax=Fodinibius salsisoli TaxID=2820877 RepID=A0ABT3PTR1_9BACT|nr:TonB-dependent receptor [Fodinibius salsisoli]MCW9709217.1 hypothetical protein [Fodinibius salsisoli]